MTGFPEAVLWAGLTIGLAFGLVARLGRFCLTSGLRGWLDGDGAGLRAFALALAVALLASQGLDAAGLVPLSRSLYMQPAVPALVPVGGLLFGYGMVMANGCGARALVLLAGGNLRSVLVLLALGIAAHMTLTGVIAPLRVAAAGALAFEAGVSPPTLPALLASGGLDAGLARWLVVLLLAGALLAFVLRDLSEAPLRLGAGAAVGLLVAAGWAATGILGADDFDPAPLASLTFVAPIGDTIQYAMLATGTRLSFGVAIVLGVVLGAAGAALASGTARLEGFTRPAAMLRYMGGGALMGVGGALALGCSIGQGLTGLSTLALTAFPAAAGILAGALLGLRGPLRLGPPNP